MSNEKEVMEEDPKTTDKMASWGNSTWAYLKIDICIVFYFIAMNMLRWYINRQIGLIPSGNASVVNKDVAQNWVFSEDDSATPPPRFISVSLK